MKRFFIFVLICLISLLSSCSKSENLSNKNLNPKLKNLISDTYVNEIRYSNEDFQEIYASAKKYGIVNPYIPTRGVGSDYVMEIREKQESIQIVFPHFSLTQSLQKIIPNYDISEERDVDLKIGNAKWISKQNQSPTVLYIKINNVFILISTAKSFQEKDFENVIESLVPLIDESN